MKEVQCKECIWNNQVCWQKNSKFYKRSISKGKKRICKLFAQREHNPATNSMGFGGGRK